MTNGSNDFMKRLTLFISTIENPDLEEFVYNIYQMIQELIPIEIEKYLAARRDNCFIDIETYLNGRRSDLSGLKKDIENLLSGRK